MLILDFKNSNITIPFFIVRFFVFLFLFFIVVDFCISKYLFLFVIRWNSWLYIFFRWACFVSLFPHMTQFAFPALLSFTVHPLHSCFPSLSRYFLYALTLHIISYWTVTGTYLRCSEPDTFDAWHQQNCHLPFFMNMLATL